MVRYDKDNPKIQVSLGRQQRIAHKAQENYLVPVAKHSYNCFMTIDLKKLMPHILRALSAPALRANLLKGAISIHADTSSGETESIKFG